MAKKIALLGILLVIIAVGIFIMQRRSTMMNSGSQVSAGRLVAVSSSGAPIPAPVASGNLPANTAMQASGNLLVSLSISPYPPSGGDASTFIVKLVETGGQPVSDANISLDLTMPKMWMPANQITLTAGDAGTYQASGYFTMRGLWRIEVIITRGGQKQSVFFDVGL